MIRGGVLLNASTTLDTRWRGHAGRKESDRAESKNKKESGAVGGEGRREAQELAMFYCYPGRQISLPVLESKQTS